MLERTKRYAMVIGATAAIAVPYGQYKRPIPFVPRMMPEEPMSEPVIHMWETIAEEDTGYSEEFRDNFDKLVASSIKPERN